MQKCMKIKVRRTAEIVLVDADDQECIDAKSKLYAMQDGKWVVNEKLLHRQMSNNSIYYKEKPTRERLKWQLEKMRYSGEPGWVNEVAGAKRRPNMNGVNPCGEILLDSKGLCNLTTLNVMAFVENGELNIADLSVAQRLSVRANYRMTCLELELPEWDAIQQRDKLLGCSLTGWQDMVNATGMSKEREAEVLRLLRDVAHNESKVYSESLGLKEPLLVTTVKPEGTLSQLPSVSSGVHYSHSPYFIRRVRINYHDKLAKAMMRMGYNWNPEVGQTLDNMSTVVFDFPVKAPEGKTKSQVSAIEQLENYKLFMENYVDHNVSITVHVRDNEWQAVEDWVYDNWDDVVAISFIPLDDSFYQLLPYEEITKEEYEIMLDKTPIFDYNILMELENGEDYSQEDGCDAGVCPVR